MPLRINRRKQGDITVLQVDGWLQGEEVQEFVRVAWSAPPPLALDLKDVRSADRRGIEAIRSLATDGVELWNVSPFIRLLLELPESEKNP